MRAQWKIGVAAVVLVVSLGVLLTEGVLIPRQLQPNVLPMRLLSVAPTDGGKRAVYVLYNKSDSRIDVWAPAELYVGEKARYEHQEIHINPLSVDAGQAAELVVNVPNAKGWQLMLRVARHGDRRGTVVFSDWSADTSR